MSNKTGNDQTNNFSSDEFKDPAVKNNFGKMDDELYHEEDDVTEKVIRVKRVAVPNKDEKWKLLVDGKIIFIVEGNKLTNKEKDFLRGINGINFLIGWTKSGVKSFNDLRMKLKNIMGKRKDKKSKR